MEIILLFFIFLTGLCLGSFINVLAHRILHEKNFWTPRSACPSCHHVIAWYDNIPLLSWLLLGAQCRQCKAPISPLYPFTELITGIILTALFYTNNYYSFFAYSIFFCALIAATRTDLEAMVIPQLFSLFLVPLGLIFSYFGLTQISLLESIIGAFLGYFILWSIAYLFKKLTGKDGMGVGDMELLALIGSFLGPLGIWVSLMLASFSGLLLGGIYVLATGKKQGTRIPFGPFLALGATVYFFFKHTVLNFFLRF